MSGELAGDCGETRRDPWAGMNPEGGHRYGDGRERALRKGWVALKAEGFFGERERALERKRKSCGAMMGGMWALGAGAYA